MSDHLDNDALRRLVHRRCHASRAYGWLLHLLACAHCRRRVVEDHPERGERFLREIFQTQQPLEPPDLEDPERLDRILADLQTRGLADYLHEGDIPPLLRGLHLQPPERQRLILDNTKRLWTLSTAIHLLERSKAELFKVPEQGLHLADLALSCLQRLHPDHYHPRLLADYQGRALMTRGNYHRILQRYSSARKDFEQAGVALQEGSGDYTESARLLSMRGVLASCSYCFEESIRLRVQGRDLCQHFGDQGLVLEFELGVAKALQDAGKISRSAERYRRLLGELDPDQVGPRLVRLARNNLAGALASLGRGIEAYRLHQGTARHFAPHQPRWQLKFQVTRTWVLEALGDFRGADTTRCAVRDNLGPYFTLADHASFWADRARWALRRKDRPRAKRYAREACELFAKAQAPAEALAVQRMIAGGELVFF